MSWLYPERWPGWMDHARVGGGLFDDAPGLVQVLTSCWQHYSAATGLAARVALSPPPTLRIVFREDVLLHRQWAALFAHAKEAFRPEISGVALPVTFAPVNPAHDINLLEARHFAFVLESPQHQHMTCFFYLDQRVVGAMDLGQINLLGDRRQLAIQRRLGITRGSDIHTCYQTSPLWDELPEAMQRDLRYLGWTFGFATEAGTPKITIDTLPAVGFLEGGELSILEGASLELGVATTFYQGLRNHQPDPGLTCRMLVVPKGVQPAHPRLAALECFLHAHPQEGDLLDIRAWIESAPMLGEVTLQIAGQPVPVSLEGGRPTQEGQLLYHATLPVDGLRAGSKLQMQINGQNQFGLAFAAHEELTTLLRPTTSLQPPQQTILSAAQLRREWELVALCESHPNQAPPTFALAAVTLWLQSGAHPPVQLPLASTTPGKLLFRYLPGSISQQLSLETLARGETLRAWITQLRNDQPMPAHASWLCQQGNRPDAPLCEFRIVDFDSTCRLLPPDSSYLIAKGDELAIEGHRIQALTGLQRTNATTSDAIADTTANNATANDATSPATAQEAEYPEADLLLLASGQGQREITLTHQGQGWLSTQSRSPSQESMPPMAKRLRALWFSCDHRDQWIEQPAGRNPEGGPCLAFGLGLGSTQEMAQIRPDADGFRLYRHRRHIVVFADGIALPMEPHGDATGHRLAQKAGWLTIDQAIIRYQCHHHKGQQQLHLTHFGYLHQRPKGHSRIHLVCGPPTEAESHIQTDDASAPLQIHIPGEKRRGTLSLSTPEPPPPGRPLALWQLLQGRESLPTPLRYGDNVEYGSLSWSIWSLEPHTALSSQTPALGTPLLPAPEPPAADAAPRLFLELRRPYGRKRFALSTRRGRLGFWREGSAFLSVGGTVLPVMAQQTQRTLPDGTSIPAEALLAGSDVSQADLILPMHLPLPSLPFALCWQQHRLWLLPLRQDTCPIQLHRYPKGRMSIVDVALEPSHQADLGQVSFDVTPVPDGRSFFRCGDVIFEISAAKDDRQEQPDADLLLSIRGVCHTLNGAFAIGGAHHLTPLPLLDPVPPFAPDVALVTIYPPALHIRCQGEALFGIQQPAPDHALIDQFRRALRETPPVCTHEHAPHHYLASLIRPTIAPQHKADKDLTPTQWLHQNTTLPTAFLSDGDVLPVGPLSLTYQFRSREDGHPTVDRAPARLAVSPVQEIAIDFGKGDDGFVTPGGKAIASLTIGRVDPALKHEEIDPQRPGEIQLSQTYQEGDQSCAKLLLSGYAPRISARILRKHGQLQLDIPAPAQPDQYHLTVAGTPIREARQIPIDATLEFHINHLLMLRLTPEAHGLRVQLTGYILGHQRDPARPIQIAQAHRVGRIYLRSPGPQPAIALQTALCPPHFRTAQGMVPGPLPFHSLHQEGELSLVDLQAWQPSGPLSLRPTDCDRLVWLASAPDSGMHFPLPPDALPSNANGPAWGDEGSSFAFGNDEGSSFAFGPPEPAPGAPDTDAASTQEAPEAAFPSILLGWQVASEASSKTPESPFVFGFCSRTGGPQARVFQGAQGEWLVAPGDVGAGPYFAQDSHSEERALSLAVWHQEQWQPLHTPHPITKKTLLLCGPAGFQVTPAEDGQGILLQRLWLWLPARSVVRLDQGACLPNQMDQHTTLWLGLGDTTPGSNPQNEALSTSLCEIWPLRRGHALLRQSDMPEAPEVAPDELNR